MIKTSGALAAIAAFVAAADARLHLPKATGSVVLPLDGISPKPTAPPTVHDLRRRQDSSSSGGETVLVAPDETCGYISGRFGASYFCNGGAQCVFLTASSTVAGAVACCDQEQCGFRVACVDYEELQDSSLCDNGCKQDIYTLKCSDSAAPYCNTISFSSDIYDFWCNTLDISTIQKAYTTYNGQTDDRTFEPVALDGSSTSFDLSATETSLQPSADATKSSDSGDGSNGSGSGSGNNDGSQDGGSKKSGGSSTPIGPIVGGVVGGVAAIALAGLGIFFFLRNKKKKNAAAAQAAATSPPMQQQQPPPGFNGQQTYYDPKFAAAAGQQGYNQPPNGGFYSVSSQSPDPNNPVSPSSHMTDPRFSQVAGSSPSPSYAGTVPPPQPGFQPQGAVIHEAPAQPSDHHRGQMHELA